ncbi:MAG: hypothetical protein K8F29_05015 [Kofleriaceae bacterium]|nr:hypothetical protein [Candidatus Methylomirabilis lanthanidiphila]
MKWYVVYTRPRHERTVCERLLRDGFESWLPLAIVWRATKGEPRKASTPLFPRRLFVRCYLEMYNLLELVTTPGVIRLMVDEHGRFVVIPDEEVVLLRRLCEAEVAVEAATSGCPGVRGQVVGGPLAGITGVIRSDHPKELLIPMQTLKEYVTVAIGEGEVLPVSVGE